MRPGSGSPRRPPRGAVPAALAAGLVAIAGAAARSLAADAPRPGERAPDPEVLRGHRAGVTSVQFSPDGEWIVSGSLDGTVRLWGAGDGAPAHAWDHGSEVYAVAIAPDGDLVASSGLDGRIVFWEIGFEAPLLAVPLPDWSVAVAFAPDGALVAGSTDGGLRRIEPVSGEVRALLDAGNEILGLALSPDGRSAATSPPIKVWDLESGRLLKAVPGHGQGGLAYAPDGSLLAAAEWVAGARIFAVPGFASVAALRFDLSFPALGPTGFAPITVNMPAAAVAFSPDGARLAVASTDRGVHLFDVVEGRIAQPAAHRLRGHAMTVTSVCFAPKGPRLASGSLDGTVRVWEVE